MKKLTILFIIILAGQSYAQEPKEIMRSIYFGGGSYGIDNGQRQSLYKLISEIPNIEFYEIIITSHTDNLGSRELNEYLSRMRSESVIQQLIHFQVPQEIIKYKDFGMDAPVFNNDTWEGRFRNRRVDILFTPIAL
jgi:outer membrane protein OmpA-like peptidoglycan-associated protein